MKHSENRFSGCRGRSIYYQHWAPESEPRALLLVSHGLGEHSARYLALASYFVGHDYAVAALDHNGHGCSEGIPGDVQAFEDYLSDLSRFREIMADHYRDLPVILLGHSMGAMIGACYLFRAQQHFVGAVMSGIPIKTGEDPGPVLQILIRILARLTPRLGLSQLDARGVSRDPEVVRNYVEDPLVYHGKLGARLLREFFSGIRKLESEASSLTLPLLLLHGSEDAMVLAESSTILHESVSSTDKSLTIYPGLYHEVFNEPERGKVLADVLNWCNAHLQASQ